MNNSTQESLKELAEITAAILKQEIDYMALKKHLDRLSSLFQRASKLNLDDEIHREHLALSSGKAIGLKWAAMCIQDLIRTKQFISGVNTAILDQQVIKKEGPIQILYAGTGPFATLVMPLITQFTHEEIQISCLEVNPMSIRSLENVINALDAGAYFRAIHQCDASNFNLPDPDVIDIVVIEVLQCALAREPQVAITYNLIPQLPPNVTLIPEEISLHVALIDTKKQTEHMFNVDATKEVDYMAKIAEVFTLNKEAALANRAGSKPLSFPEMEVLFPKNLLKGKSLAVILTEIQVYDSHALKIRESGLTVPSIFADLNYEEELLGVKTQYLVNDDPYLQTVLIR